MTEQPWPSGNALDSDEHGPKFEAQRRPLVTPGRAPVLNARARIKSSQRHPSSPKELGETEVKSRNGW